MVTGRFNNRTFGKRKKIADGESNHRQFQAEGAWQPWNAVERIALIRSCVRTA
jgi:hypothetical protein